MTPPVPLSTLLSWAWVAFTMEADNLFEARSAPHRGRAFRISLPVWTNALRALAPEGITVAAMQEQTGAWCNLGGLERWGWISLGEAPATRRAGFGTRRGIRADTMVRPTRLGEYAGRTWPLVLEEVEARWRARFGTGPVDELRRGLGAASATPPPARLPWSPPEVHASDGFLTHVIASGPARDAEEVAEGDLPLAALLGQAIVSLTLSHEAASLASLPLAANALRTLDPPGTRQRDLPTRSGISKEAVAMAVGFLRRHNLATVGVRQTLALTAAGRKALADYEARAATPENPPWRHGLEAILARRDALAAGLVPPPGTWRAAAPYRRQTDRLLSDPTAALPRQPMVLHRGGWPDGS